MELVCRESSRKNDSFNTNAPHAPTLRSTPLNPPLVLPAVAANTGCHDILNTNSRHCSLQLNPWALLMQAGKSQSGSGRLHIYGVAGWTNRRGAWRRGRGRKGGLIMLEDPHKGGPGREGSTIPAHRANTIYRFSPAHIKPVFRS